MPTLHSTRTLIVFRVFLTSPSIPLPVTTARDLCLYAYTYADYYGVGRRRSGEALIEVREVRE
jgi:hypothetical protein